MSKQQPKEESPKNLEDMSVEELRIELKKSNRNRSFERSKKINEMIINKNATNYESKIQPIIKELESKLDSLFKEFNAIADEKGGEYQQNEDNLRESIDNSFAEIQQRQISELTKLEIEKTYELSREKERLSSSVNHLIQLSIKLADRQEFDKAIDTDREAENLRQRETEGRLYDIKTKYKKLNDNLFQKFTFELNGLQEKLDSGLNLIRTQHQQQILNAQKTTEVSVKSALLAAINRASSAVVKKEKLTEITAKLTSIVVQKAEENGMNKNLVFEQ